MGAEKALVLGLVSFFACGMAWIIVQPILDVFMPMFIAAGGAAAFVGGLLTTVFDYYAVLGLVLVLVSMFVGAMKDTEVTA
ncbi:MAG: hypothetical protein A4E24_01747 [Methanomethylovorans sp. PtaU1.Bin093]|uniref:hypothetical protein n=1 Tax=Methanomethylovorans sp. PtaU1.Bin093 TaxID=1811679 RepID=UPI0009CAB919|nr:hypothetical protein [Methanomethylovorans sp. PtaU1.Bin093]OPY18992.1 MAG: hypothetical protein A4E24_01747 [Methanomethylovorans sp. PtaU1.Bin093]